MSDDDPLEELVEEADEARQQYTEAQQRLHDVKNRLRELTEDLHGEGLLTEPEAEKIQGLVSRGDYGEARERLQDAKQAASLEFDNEEKSLFARRFAESYDELEASVEDVRTSILELTNGIDRDDLATYLYGKHSSLRKSDIEAVFDAIDSVDRQGLGARQMARVLSNYDHDLGIEDATQVIEAIQEEAGRDD